jgi:hypothetical protein
MQRARPLSSRHNFDVMLVNRRNQRLVGDALIRNTNLEAIGGKRCKNLERVFVPKEGKKGVHETRKVFGSFHRPPRHCGFYDLRVNARKWMAH